MNILLQWQLWVDFHVAWVVTARYQPYGFLIGDPQSPSLSLILSSSSKLLEKLEATVAPTFFTRVASYANSGVSFGPATSSIILIWFCSKCRLFWLRQLVSNNRVTLSYKICTRVCPNFLHHKQLPYILIGFPGVVKQILRIRTPRQSIGLHPIHNHEVGRALHLCDQSLCDLYAAGNTF